MSHTIASGETLFSIASRYNVSVDALRAANGLSGDLIYAGQVLRIPTDVIATQPATILAAGVHPFPAGGPRHITLERTSGTTLAGSSWVLVGLNDGYVLKGTRLTLAFTAEGLSGTGACASYSATYLVRAPGVLEVGPTAISERGCDPQVRADTLGFFSSLADATTWVHDAHYLYLRDGAGNILATLGQPEAGLPTITALTVKPSTTTADSALTIEWTTTNVSATKLQVLHGDDSVHQWSYAVDQPANGRFVLDDVPQHNGGTTRVYLEAYGPNGLYVTEIATVQLPCRYASPFAPSYPHGCPSGPAAAVQLIEQRFEHGWMLWLSDPAWVGGAVDILVLYDGGGLAHYTDTWREGDPGPVDIAPTGLVVPERSFGAVWADYDNVRQGLGWATEPEHPVTDAQVQRFGGYKQPTLHLRLSDGRVVYLTAPSSGPHSWQFD